MLTALTILVFGLAVGLMIQECMHSRTILAQSTPSIDAWPIQPVQKSPSIAELENQLQLGASHALDDFWRHAATRGAPNTQNVALLAPLVKAPGLSPLPLTHITSTDVWYSSWEMRNDFRFTYRFVVNLKPGEDPHRLAKLDLLNSHRMDVAFEGGQPAPAKFSIAAMPHAIEDGWSITRLGVPSGELESHVLKSAILANERRFWIYTPASYSAKSPEGYRLLLLFDGFAYQQWIAVAATLDNLIDASKIPPIVAALIDNPVESRTSDLGYNSAFVSFLAGELLPWLRTHFNVTHDAQKTVVGGYSMGGAAAAFPALRRPDLFGNVLSQSGSYWEGHQDAKWEFLAEQYANSPKLQLRFFVEAGLLENVSKEGPTLLNANRHFVQVLRSKGYRVDYEEVGGTHEPVHWRSTFPEGLMALIK